MEPKGQETLSDSSATWKPRKEGSATPGLVLVFSDTKPRLDTFGLEDGQRELGRNDSIDDYHLSRKHARVLYDGRRWFVTDLNSRNGTFVDGNRVTGQLSFEAPRVIRLGHSIFLVTQDLDRFQRGVTVAGTSVIGPSLAEIWEQIAQAARFGTVLHVTGESGCGKELAARAFHEFGPRQGAFIAVNCGAIPEGLAERLIFGARRGAFSGADRDSDGYLQAADRGTLFLDELGELDESVQAKLLRVLETREVVPLGASKGIKVDLRICSATNVDLRAAVVSKRMRADLYFRLGRPEVHLPPLRQRLEEIPWHIHRELQLLNKDLTAHAAFVEACLLRAWPGNIRELIAEARSAGARTLTSGERRVGRAALSSIAGLVMEASPGPPAAASASEAGEPDRSAPGEPDEAGVHDDDARASDDGVLPDDARIENALRAANGFVTRAARSLGVHRNHIRRWMAKRGLDPRNFRRPP